jgi:acyl carrier protein
MIPAAVRHGGPEYLEGLEWIPDGAVAGMVTAGTVGFSAVFLNSAVQLGATFDAYEIRRLGLAGVGDWLERSGVQWLFMVPTVLRFVLPTLRDDLVLPDIRLVLTSGETLTWEDVAALRRHLPRRATVVNLFGLTETAGIARLVIDADTPVGHGPLPAGRPRPWARVTIVDEQGHEVPDGVAGEIVVEGYRCMLGYWNQPELTARVLNHIGGGHMGGGRRRVRTGDSGRMRPDGILEHLGRLDHVVKVSGNRVELGDVEAAASCLPGVLAAAATNVEDSGGHQRLVCFAVPQPGSAPEETELRALLTGCLAGPAVPDRVHVVGELPTLANGKVDRLTLRDWGAGRRSPSAFASTDGSLQGQLAVIWARCLSLEAVGPDDDFFALGGDSLRAAQVFVEIERQLGVVRPSSLLVHAPTIRALAAALGAPADLADLLVSFNSGGSQRPLFVVHDGGGDVFYAGRLARHLGDDQPVHAVQPSLLLGDDLAGRSFEDVARMYLAAVRRVQPTGPYRFYGFSLGGTVAFEMARQAQLSGDEVDLLALGDSPAPMLPAMVRARGRVGELRGCHRTRRPGVPGSCLPTR